MQGILHAETMSIIEEHLKNLLPYGILTLITCVMVFLISLNLILRGYRSRLVRAVFFFSVCLSAWMLCGGLMIVTPSYSFASYMARYYFIGWVFIPTSFLYLVLIFRGRGAGYVYPVLGLSVAFSILFLTTPVYSAHYNYFGFYPKLIYPWNLIINTFYFTTVSLGLVGIFDEYLMARSNSRKNQARLLWLGTSAGFMIALTETLYVVSATAGLPEHLVTVQHHFINVILQAAIIILYVLLILGYKWSVTAKFRYIIPLKNPVFLIFFLTVCNVIYSLLIFHFGKPLYPWSHIGIIIALLIISYAILKYRLIDITEIFQRLLVYLLLSGSFFGIWIIFIIGISPASTEVLMSIVYALLVVALFNPLHMLVQRMVNRLIFSHRFDYHRTIMDMSMKVVTVLDYNRLIEIVRETIIKTVKAGSFALMVYEDENDSYIPVAFHGIPHANINSLSPMDEMIRFLRLVNREIFRDELEDDQGGSSGELLETFSLLQATLIIPMTYQGYLRGMLCIGDRKTGDIYTRRDIELLQILANHLVIALENARLYELAIRDGLTKLYISRFFHQRLNEDIANTIRARRLLSLLMIDLDFFKNVNDTHGHQAGDSILKSTANIISDQVRLVDIVSRYGGEEFAVILPETDNDRAVVIADRIRSRIENTVFINNIRITISIGIATLDGNSASEQVNFDRIMSRAAMHSAVEEIKSRLINHADGALYAAKSAGRNRCENFGILK